MRIALVGYGKMGKIIEGLAIERGHSISYKINAANSIEIENINPGNTDVCIEFSIPDAAYKNLKNLIANRNKVICGTTGWLDAYHEICHDTLMQEGAFLYASNFSVGVNLFFALNLHLAKLMSNQKNYEASIEEIHHTSKKDAPSGTGLTLAKQILQYNLNYNDWVNEESHDAGILPLVSKRIDPAPGTHTVSYKSDIDQIDITHTAHSRKGFALGAILAAEFLSTKIGVFTMNDVLTL